MNYDELVNYVIGDTRGSLKQFLPELVLCGTIIVMLLFRVSDLTRKLFPSWLVAMAGSLTALWLALPLVYLSGGTPHEKLPYLFTGMLVYDPFTIFFRVLLIFVGVLFIAMTKISGLADDDNSPDFYSLTLGALVGMCLMASANHLLIIFLAVEMASVPSYALAGFLKGNRRSSEASMKYAVYGAGAAGVMLYGISLIAGITGSAHLPTIAWRLAAGAGAEFQWVLILAALLIMVGLAFKLSAVPFHFWCPDVFEGASAEVNGFLSVASKAAALALLVRVAVGFSVAPHEEPNIFSDQSAAVAELQTGDATGVPATAVVGDGTGKVEIVQVSDSSSASPVPKNSAASMESIRKFLAYLIGILAAVTCTFGNLAAYGQTNIKRLLAYSTIAHAGYMMMPIAAGLMMLNTHPSSAQNAFSALLVYAVIYVFMNMGAFAVVAFLRNAMDSEEISDYAGLVRSNPGIVVCFAVILFSLLGMPPLAGFMAKLVIFASLVEAGMMWLLVIGGINTAISLFYYVKVVKVMTFDPEPDNRGTVTVPMFSVPGLYVATLTAPVLLLIIQWNGLNEWAIAACKNIVP